MLDATGLEGAYDFPLNFSPAGMARATGRGGRGGAEMSDHGERPEKSWFPSAPNGSGLTPATAESGNSA